MTIALRCAMSLSLLGCAACGGSSHDQTGGPIGAGSFELTTVKVDVVGNPQVPNEDSALEYVVRVDLREAAAGFEAVVTPRGGVGAPYQVAGSGSLTLTTPAPGGATVTVGPDRDTWTTLHLADGKFDAQIDRQVSCGDCYWGEQLAVSGSVASDTHPATFGLTTDMKGVPGTALPWSTLALNADEGVSETALTDRVKILADSGETLAASWQVDPPAAGTEWAGVRSLHGAFDDFAAFVNARNVSVVVGAGVPDLAGNAASELSTPLQVIGIGAPKTSLDFVAAVPDLGGWGTHSILGAGSGACDSDGCLLLGPEKRCGATSGMAARLNVSGKKQVVVRARALAASAEYFSGSAFSLSLVAPGGTASPQPIIQGQKTLTALAAPVGGAAWATDWVDATFDVPAGASEVGISIGSPFQGCYYGSPSDDHGFVIDGIQLL